MNLVLGQAVLAFAFGILRWSAVSANILAAGVATVPTYLLYRRWVWQQTGRSHLRREVAPFMVVVVVGLVVVTWAADLGEAAGARITDARLGQTVVVVVFTLAACFALWVARFFFLDQFLFGKGPRDQSAAEGG
jgi:putative flippase GtrA